MFKMKIFIGQAVTGEDINKLKEEMDKIVPILKDAGHEAYCTFMKEDIESISDEDKLKHAFEKIDESDCFLAIVRSDKRSEGMLMEVGYTLSKNKKLILAVNKNVKTFLGKVSDKVIEFENINDLYGKLKDLK